MGRALELLVEREGTTVRLLSPEVGVFTLAVPRGRVLAQGAPAGVIRSLGLAFDLVVPKGVLGRVVSRRPERVNEPVGYGTPLYELETLATGADDEAPAHSARRDGVLAFRAPYAGRYWHRAAPGEPAFVRAGAVVTETSTVGLIEVMKTFTRLGYAPGDDLPERARILRVVARDGAEVDAGEPLFELEPA
jgi:acetyl-CoA carboxylase biotin carboxyl carrier protein